MDITNYVSGITANISSETQPKSIPASVVGQAFTDLANLTKTNIDIVSGATSGNTVAINSLQANLSGLTATVTGNTASIASLASNKLDVTGSTIFLTGVTTTQVVNALGVSLVTDPVTPTNLFNKSTVIPNQFVNTGTFLIIKDSSASGWTTSNYIPVTAGGQITINGLTTLSSKAVQFADANKVIITGGTQGVLLTTAPQTITIPSGCFYIILTVQRSSDVTDFSTVMVNTGSTALPYQAYSSGILVSTVNNNAIMAKGLVSGATINGKTIASTDLIPTVSATTILGKNLFNTGTTIFLNSAISTSGGGIFVLSGYSRCDYIPASGNVTYTVSGLPSLTSKAVRFEDVSGTITGFWLIGASGATFTTPSATTRLTLTVSRNDETFNPNTFQLETGSTATAYAAYSSVSYLNAVNNAIVPASESPLTFAAPLVRSGNTISYTGGAVTVSSTTIASRNLFNIATSTDGFFLENTNIPSANATYGYSDYIPVIAGLTYTGFDGTNGMRKTCFYDANKNVLSGSGSTNTVTTFTIPSGVAYVKVTYFVGVKATFQFEQSAVATPFVAFNNTTYLNSVNNFPIAPVSLVPKTITLKNREVDIWFGDSYSMGEYNLKGKSYLDNLSMFTDRNIENYSRSGDRLDNILSRIQTDNKTYHTTLGINEYPSGGYGFILSWTNEFNSGGTMYNASGVTAYIANMKLLADAVKGLGLKPVICTEYYTTNTLYGSLIESALSELASENGYLFVDLATKSQLTRGATDNPKYWFGSHPGVRTNTIFWHPFVKYIQSLPRPKTGIKIFRKRVSFSGTTAASLNYNTLIDRSTAFKELFIGQSAASGTSENYYDDLTTLNTSGTYAAQKVCDYIKLQNKEATAFADYGLFEVVVNATANNVTSLSLNVSGTTGLTGYVKDWVNNAWVAIAPTTVNGYQVFTISNNQTQIKYDKASFLIYQSSGYTINDVNVSWSGSEGKDTVQKALPVELGTAQLLSATTISSGYTGWTATGTITPFVPTDTNVPSGAVQVATIDNSNYLSQVITFPAETERTRKVQIKVTGRRNPAVFISTGATYPTGAAITDDTYDLGTIGVDLQLNTANIITFDRVVGLHWSEAFIEFVLPPNVSTLTMSVKGRSGSIEFAKASVRIEN